MMSGVCHFLLVINSNLGRISHRFRKNAHFPTPVYSTPNLKMFPLHRMAKVLHA